MSESQSQTKDNLDLNIHRQKSTLKRFRWVLFYPTTSGFASRMCAAVSV